MPGIISKFVAGIGLSALLAGSALAQSDSQRAAAAYAQRFDQARSQISGEDLQDGQLDGTLAPLVSIVREAGRDSRLSEVDRIRLDVLFRCHVTSYLDMSRVGLDDARYSDLPNIANSDLTIPPTTDAEIIRLTSTADCFWQRSRLLRTVHDSIRNNRSDDGLTALAESIMPSNPEDRMLDMNYRNAIRQTARVAFDMLVAAADATETVYADDPQRRFQVLHMRSEMGYAYAQFIRHELGSLDNGQMLESARAYVQDLLSEIEAGFGDQNGAWLRVKTTQINGELGMEAYEVAAGHAAELVRSAEAAHGSGSQVHNDALGYAVRLAGNAGPGANQYLAALNSRLEE